MCATMTPARAFSINGVPFAVVGCRRHLHARAAVSMPSGGVVSIDATARTRPEVVRVAAGVLAEVLALHAAELAHPNIHPAALVRALGTKRVKMKKETR